MPFNPQVRGAGALDDAVRHANGRSRRGRRPFDAPANAWSVEPAVYVACPVCAAPVAFDETGARVVRCAACGTALERGRARG
jgi:hypothetical protein